MLSPLLRLPLAFVAVVAAAASASATLRMTCAVGGEQLVFVGVNGTRATVSDGVTEREPVEIEGTTWSLDFDPEADARSIHWSPRWAIKRDDGPDESIRPQTPYRVRISVGQWNYEDWNGETHSGDFSATWPVESARGGVLVFAWLEEMRATQVHVVPVPQHDLKRFRVKTDFLLSESATRGRPVVLLWSNGRFTEVVHRLQTGKGSAIYLALMRDDVAWLDENAGDIPDMIGIAGQSLFHAVQCGSPHAAKWLLALGPKCADWRDADNRNALHIAADYGRVNLIEALLAAGATPRLGTIETATTPLHIAVRGGHTAIVRMLIKAGAEVHAEDRQHHTAFGLAIDHGYADIAEIVADSKDRPLLRGSAMEDVLINQSALGHSAIVAWLASKGVSAEQQRNGQCAIIAGARYGNAQMLAAILKRGALLDSKMENGRTALMVAATHGNHEYATALIEAGATLGALDKDGRTALHLAAANDQEDMVTMLLDRGALMDSRDNSGYSAMELATRVCARKSAALLAARGSHVLVSGPDVLDVMKYAIRLDLVDIVRTALGDGWPPDTELRPGWPALHLARTSKSKGCIQLLGEAGAIAATGTPVFSTKTLDAPLTKVRHGAIDDPRDIDDRFPAAEIVVETIVDADGTCLAPIVRQTDTPELIPYALAAILETRFAPLSSGGRPAATTTKILVRFPAASDRVLLQEETDEAPRPISHAMPKYPAGASARGTEARVELRYTVEADGTVSNLKVMSTTGQEFTDAVLNAAKTWRFQPGKRDGKPVAVRMHQPISFSLYP